MSGIDCEGTAGCLLLVLVCDESRSAKVKERMNAAQVSFASSMRTRSSFTTVNRTEANECEAGGSLLYSSSSRDCKLPREEEIQRGPKAGGLKNSRGEMNANQSERED